MIWRRVCVTSARRCFRRSRTAGCGPAPHADRAAKRASANRAWRTVRERTWDRSGLRGCRGAVPAVCGTGRSPRAGNQGSELRGRLVARVRCAIDACARSEEEKDIAIIAYGHGALLAIDALFPPPEECSVQANVRHLLTFGCPLALVRGMSPHASYLEHREDGRRHADSAGQAADRPNWGRVTQALRRCGQLLLPRAVDVRIGSVR